MNNETPAQLVTHLSHPNGWWRDTAQQLLVLKQDKSVVPALHAHGQELAEPARRGSTRCGRSKGSARSTPALVRQLMEDPEPRMRIQAIRASETLYKAGDRSFAADYAALTKDPSVDVVIQALLTINRWKVPDAAATTKATMESNQARGVQLVGTTMLTAAANASSGRGRGDADARSSRRCSSAAARSTTSCASLPRPGRLGTPTAEPATTMAPALAGSPRVNGHRDYIIKAVLHGLTGPLDGKTYPNMMIPMNNNDDEWVAAVASYVRHSFGNTGRIRHAGGRRAGAGGERRAQDAVDAAGARRDAADAALHRRLEGDREPQPGGGDRRAHPDRMERRRPAAAGMWFQVELPKPEMVTEIQFQSPAPGGRGGPGSTAAITPREVPVTGPPGYPRTFTVELSQDGSSWTPAAEASGTGPTTIVTFPAAQARFVRIRLTANADDAPAWSIQNLNVYAAGSAARSEHAGEVTSALRAGPVPFEQAWRSISTFRSGTSEGVSMAAATRRS